MGIGNPGYYNGRHFSSYVTDVRVLKKANRLDEAERLLLELVAATEAEAQADRSGVAPWYYEELAKIYRKRKEYAREVTVLERFARQRHSPGAGASQLAKRLQRARQLLLSSNSRECHPRTRSRSRLRRLVCGR